MEPLSTSYLLLGRDILPMDTLVVVEEANIDDCFVEDHTKEY